MNIDTEHLKLRLIESQMQVLQYQHRDISEGLAKIEAQSAKARFDAAVDARETSAA